jgi:hypothetical protein
MRPLVASLLALAAGALAWTGARYLNMPDAFGALAPREGMRATSAAVRPQATAPRVASHVNASDTAVDPTPRERLAALRAPLLPEAQNDPFSVQSWLPPPPPAATAPVAVVPQAPPVAPPLPFAYVGTLNRVQDKPQVFLANGDQLLIVSPGEVIDGRYRFESIEGTGAVFTYLPLNERQVMTIGAEGK